MNTIKATWKNGQILLGSHANWPEGRRLVIAEVPPAEIEFMTEEEQSDDPEAIERWIAELRDLPALTMPPQDEANLTSWRKKVKDFNLEAVRRQMEVDMP